MEINFKKKFILSHVHQKKHYLIYKKLNIFEKDKLVLLEDPIINISAIQNQKNNIEKNIVDNHKKFYLNIGRLTIQKNQKLLIEFFRDQVKNQQRLIIIHNR